MASTFGIFDQKFSDCSVSAKNSETYPCHAIILYEYSEFKAQLDAFMSAACGRIIKTDYTKKELLILLVTIYKKIEITDTDILPPHLNAGNMDLYELVNFCTKLSKVKTEKGDVDPIAHKLAMYIIRHIWSNLSSYSKASNFLFALKSATELNYAWFNITPKTIRRSFFVHFDCDMIINFLKNAGVNWCRTAKLHFVMKWSCILNTENKTINTEGVYKSLCKKGEVILDLPFSKITIDDVKTCLRYGFCPVLLMYLVNRGTKVDLRNIRKLSDDEDSHEDKKEKESSEEKDE